MSKETWFSAKAIFLHQPWQENMKQWYEERIVLFHAVDEKEASKKAKKEAKAYVKDLDGTTFVEITEIFSLFDQKIKNGAEVFSSKSISALEPEDYVEQFYPSTPENCEDSDEKHSWHNFDNKRSKCYNCLVVRKGKLWKTDDREN